MAENQWWEKLQVEGGQLVEEVKRLFHEGNVRHIVIKHEGHTVLEVPVTAGVVGALISPTLAAVAAVGAVVTHCTIEVLRDRDAD